MHLDLQRELSRAGGFFLLILLCSIFLPTATASAARLSEFLSHLMPAEIFPGADRITAPAGDPPLASAYTGERLLGHVYLNTDVTDATGYSGKPIHMLVAIDTDGVIRGIRLLEHKEPIVLIGIPEARVVAAMNRLVGATMAPVARGEARPPQVDIVSGATVTILVMADSVVRSAVRLIRAGRIGAIAPGAAAPAVAPATLTPGPGEVRDWESLLGDGSVRRLALSIGDINDAYARSGNAAAAANPEPGDPDDIFIELFTAPVSVPTIGRSLLGDEGYETLARRLAPGQQAIIVAGHGVYSFKGSGYVRGGIFDRIEVIQDGRPIRFRDRDHTRLGEIAADGAPDLPEIALFVVPAEPGLDPTQPWQLQLLVQRAIGARDKAFLPFELGYTLPDA